MPSISSLLCPTSGSAEVCGKGEGHGRQVDLLQPAHRAMGVPPPHPAHEKHLHEEVVADLHPGDRQGQELLLFEALSIYIPLSLYIYIMYINVYNILRTSARARAKARTGARARRTRARARSRPTRPRTRARRARQARRGRRPSWLATRPARRRPSWTPYGRFPKFHRVFVGRDPGTL